MIRKALWQLLPLVVITAATAGEVDQPVTKSDPSPIGYIVTLREPSVLAFRSRSQLADLGKSSGYQPTAPKDQTAPDFRQANVVAYRQYLAQQQQRVLGELGVRSAKSLRMTARWDVVGNGFAIKADASDVAVIRSHPDVLRVTPAYRKRPLSFAAPQTTGADSLWFGAVAGALPTRGEGILIGIGDTGITASHPAFAALAADGFQHPSPPSGYLGACASPVGAQRCNNKLIGIYDFAPEAGAEGANAGADLSGHGTQVASLAAGNPVSFTVAAPTLQLPMNFSGMAPRAQIISYKMIPNDTGITVPGADVASINQAVLDGVDVYNMSYISDFVESPWTSEEGLALLQARAAGMIAIAGAGNGGRGGEIDRVPGNAPWVLAVAANRHNGAFVTRLENLRGPGINGSLTLTGQAIAAAAADAPLVHGKDVLTGFPSCGQGTSESVPTGASNPFPPGSLAGKIVVCEEDFYRAVEMSFNAKLGGAVGIVLLNGPYLGRNFLTPAVGMHLPAVHLNIVDGNRLRDALQTALTAGTPLRAAISATEIGPSGVVGLLADYSSRGPVGPYKGVLKPNVGAPGPLTYAASETGVGYSEFSGTSAASPVVTGAAALLLGAHPDWSPDQVRSALELSAAHGLDNSLGPAPTVAGPLDDGSGMINLAGAAQVGLYFPEQHTDFLAANPDAGGNPESLNLPSIYSDRCLSGCRFTRQVKANTAGAWRFEASIDARAQIQVSPATATLAVGESADLVLQVTIPNRLPTGTQLLGEVRLVRTAGGGDQVLKLPVMIESGIGAVAPKLDLGAQPTVGRQVVALPRLAEIDQVRVLGWPLRSFAGQTIRLSNRQESRVNLPEPTAAVGRPGTKGKILIEVSSATAPDVDLYVFEDTDGDGLNDKRLCTSVSFGSDERCEIDSTWAGTNRYQYVVFSFEGSALGDDVNVRLYNEVQTGSLDLVTESMAGRTAYGDRLPLAFGWNLSAVPAGARAVSYVSLADATSEFGTIQIDLTRSNDALPALVLNARSDSEIINLQPGQAHERMVVDIPPNQSALVIRTASAPGTNGGNVDLYVSKFEGALSGPDVAPAPPRDAQPFRSLSATNTEVVGLEGAQLTAGRYYVTPVNAGTTPASFTLSVSSEFQGTTVQPKANGYFNPARSGHGVFLATTPQVWALAWYTFDEAGKPIWYTAQGAAASSNDGVWSAPLYRSTWNGVRDLPQMVGEVIVTFTGQGSFTYSWKLDGQYGSEPFVAIGNPQCANGNLSVGGGWLRPDQTGWGSYFLNFAGNFEAEAIYVYDSVGLPRWVIGDGTFATSLQKTLYQVHGFCPNCAFTPTSRLEVGTASRTLNSASAGQFSSEFTLTNGLTGTWSQSNVNWVKLTPDLSCQ
ncbi:S8 family serine peptidase [Ahniella affigens]|nr:S8 family serine peptidase [Ahniella affigens]